MTGRDLRETAFSKLVALGNDFVLIDARDSGLTPDPACIRALADRRLGIGFDQLLLLGPGADGRLASVTIYNADATSAEQCGNGMRGIAAWLDRSGELDGPAFVDTAAGPVGLARDTRAAGRYIADLPGPRPIAPETLGLPAPALPEHAAGWWLVSTGNPHLIIDWPDPPDNAALAAAVAHLASAPAWANRVNVGLMHSAGAGHILLRVHERGAGPTPACGSAACAAAWAARERADGADGISVEQPGGTLVVDLLEPQGRARTRGAASVVFEGRIA